MGEGPENACRFEAPRRWKMFGASRTLPGAGRPSKLSSRGGRALVREVTKNPMTTLSEFLSGERRTFQKVQPPLPQSGQSLPEGT